jgi:hypothetical protein
MNKRLKRVTRKRLKEGIYRIRNLQEMHAFDIHPTHPIHDTFLCNNKQRNDYEWMQHQLSYIDQLSDRKRTLMRQYSMNAYKFVNAYLRELPIDYNDLLDKCIRDKENPFMYQHRDATGHDEIDDEYRAHIIDYIQRYIEELQDVIIHAPALTKRITVFRGIPDDTHLQHIVGHHIIEKGFLSTSFLVDASARFTSDICCMLEITIDPHVPCLLIGHSSRQRHEYEILMPHGIHLVSNKRMIHKYMIIDTDHYETERILLHPDEFDITRIGTYELEAYPM